MDATCATEGAGEEEFEFGAILDHSNRPAGPCQEAFWPTRMFWGTAGAVMGARTNVPPSVILSADYMSFAHQRAMRMPSFRPQGGWPKPPQTGNYELCKTNTGPFKSREEAATHVSAPADTRPKAPQRWPLAHRNGAQRI